MKKLIMVLLLLIFGIFCFLGGYSYSNFLVKKNQTIGEAKKAEYERKFLEVSNSVISNAYLSLLIIEGTSRAWQSAISGGADFNRKIREYLNNAKESLDKMETADKEISIGMQYLKNYPVQYQEAYNTLMELYSIYSQIYALAQYPSGSLMSFNNKVNDLSSEFTKIVSKLKIYMPQLKDSA